MYARRLAIDSIATRPRRSTTDSLQSPPFPRAADGMETADGAGGVKSQLATAFAAMRNMRVPLLICNLIVVVIELLFG